jgi:hypothetical protein
VLLDQLRPAPAQDVAQDEGDDDGVVQVTGDMNELGYEVERHRQVGDERGDDELSAPGDAGVGEEAAEESFLRRETRGSARRRRKRTTKSGTRVARARASSLRPATMSQRRKSA